MPRYSAQFNRTASATLAVGAVQPGATLPRRVSLYEFNIGSEATPADNAFLWTVDRISAQGAFAGSAVTPSPLDLADQVAVATTTENVTTNPTVGVNVMAIPLNQRASFRWVAAPGSEIVTPATTSIGLLLQTPTAALVAVTATVMFSE